MKMLIVNRNIIVSIFAVLLLIYGLQGVSFAQNAPDTLVEFKDINLARSVRWKLDLPTGEGINLLKIPKAELVKLTTLEVDGRRVVDLTGLEHATQLKELVLARNNISNLTPLSQLTQLKELVLARNNISNLTPLSQLTQLMELDLSDNNISNLTPLSQLIKLRTLNLNGYDGDRSISDITPLSQLIQLTTLDLAFNKIVDITPLAQLTQLTWLDLAQNNISNLTPLAQLTKLTWLKLSGKSNKIVDITPLAQLTQLTTLDLGGSSIYDNYIGDLTPLAHLKHLGSISAISFSGPASEIPLIQVSSAQPLVEATLNGSSVVLALLRDGTSYDVSTDNIRNALTVSGIAGVTVSNITRMSDTEIEATLEFNGNFDAITMLTFTLEAEAVSGFDTRALTGAIRVHPEGGPTITASTAQALTGATLNETQVELTISHALFKDRWGIESYQVTVSGIPGISIKEGWKWEAGFHASPKLNIELAFNGDLITTDTLLTFTVEPEAIVDYHGPPLTVQIPVKGVAKADLSQAMVASTPYPLTEATLNGSVVTLRLTTESYAFSFGDTYKAYGHVKVSGIKGVTIARRSWNRWYTAQAARKISNTEITIELRFSGRIDTDATLKLTVDPDVLTPYNGPPVTAEIPVSAVTTEVAPTGELVASTPFPLTKATLDGSFVVLTLQNPSYAYKTEEEYFDYREYKQVGISGIHDIQTGQFAEDKYFLRLSRTEIRVKIDFQGDFNTDGTLTFTVPPSIIENYDGPPLTAALPVTIGTELRVLSPELQQQPMFWVNTNTSKIESTAPFDAVTNGVTVLTVDKAGEKLYWGEQALTLGALPSIGGKTGGTIKRADFDGTNVEELVSLSSVPRGIVVDAVGNRLYWTNSDWQIQTANLKGEGISTVIQLEEDIIEETKIVCSSGGFALLFFWYDGGCDPETVYTNLTSPTDIAVNPVDGRLYWTEFSGRIRRVNLDGTGLGTLVPDIGSPYGIIVADSKVYWAEEIDENTGKIQRANLNGTNIETLATVQGLPTGISVDTAVGKVYWANSLGGIQRTDLNGGEVEVVVSGITAPGDFVLVPDPQQTLPTTAAATNATVSISPASVASPAIGQQLEFSLNITGGEAVKGYQATVQFDTTTLRYVESRNGDYLPDGALFISPTVDGNLVKLTATALTGESSGAGTLATLTFEVVAVKASTLTLSNVLLVNNTGESSRPKVEDGQITVPSLNADVNGDGSVDLQDLATVQSHLGETGQNKADVNGDGVVDVVDLTLVASAIENNAAAPSLHPQSLEMFTAADVKTWLSQAQYLDLTDSRVRKGILFLQHLLVALTPKETALLANYPNPFNPETWLPYQLSKPADVTLTIYAVDGQVVRRLVLGHQPAGMYQSRSRAAYWDGRNAFGESVASGIYFYTLTAGDFTATRKMLIRK